VRPLFRGDTTPVRPCFLPIGGIARAIHEAHADLCTILATGDARQIGCRCCRWVAIA
jgi:hypothetical protein